MVRGLDVDLSVVFHLESSPLLNNWNMYVILEVLASMHARRSTGDSVLLVSKNDSSNSKMTFIFPD